MTDLTLAKLVDYATQSTYSNVQAVYNAIALAYTEAIARGAEIETTGVIAEITFSVEDDKQAMFISQLAVLQLAESVKHAKGRAENIEVKSIADLVSDEMLEWLFNSQEFMEDEGDNHPSWQSSNTPSSGSALP